MPKSNASSIPQLDGIRGAAILLVVAFHYLGYPHGEVASGSRAVRAFFRIFDLGWVGVDLFFALSGFLLVGILLDHKGCSNYFSIFYLRRTARILPLYWSWLLVYLAVWQVLRTPHLTGGHIPFASHLLFAQNILMAKAQSWSNIWLGISWSLAIEEQFYLIIPVLVLVLSRRQFQIGLALFVVISPLLRLWCVSHYQLQTGIPLYVLLPTHGDGLALGSLLATVVRKPCELGLYLKHRRLFLLPGLLCLAALVIDLAVYRAANLSTHATNLYTVAAFMSATVVIDAVAVPNGLIARLMLLRPLRFFGSISYCLYLVHEVILAGLLKAVLGSFTPQWTLAKAGTTLLAFGISVLVCVFSLHVLEKPILRQARRFPYLPAREVTVAKQPA